MKTYTVKSSNYFNKWLNKLPLVTKLRIARRIERIEEDGYLGDHKWFGDIGELRFFFGSGYRIYYTIKGNEIFLLLNGGDKSSQDEDIAKARNILSTSKE